VLADQPTEGGELHPVEGATGVTAVRTFKDGRGNPTRKIFYVPHRPPHALQPAPAEDALLEHSTEVYHYDADGRLILTATYDSGRRLFSSRQLNYWPDGKLKLEQYCRYATGRAVVVSQRRFAADGDRTDLTWDEGGRRLTSISGLVPADVDLADGWGPATAGLRCGIVSDKGPGLPAGVGVFLSIKNVSDTALALPQAEVGRLVRPELTDAAGRALPYSQGKIQRLLKLTYAGPNSLAPNHATSSFYALADWYGKVPPGRYMLLLRRLTLVSNTVAVEITPPIATLSVAADHLHLEVEHQEGKARYDIYPDRVIESGYLVTGGTSLTIEDVTIRARDGRVTFVSAAGLWTAALAGDKINLTATDAAGSTRQLQGERFQLQLYQGQVHVPPENKPAAGQILESVKSGEKPAGANGETGPIGE
jgi:hypothetical protein